MPATTRPLQPNDFPNWLPLWNENNLGRKNEPVTTETWARLMDPHYPVYGLCALSGGEMAGLVHYVLHPTTGAVEPVCYMQDVYVAENFRRSGIARQLVGAVADRGRAQGWARLYWLADEANDGAQALYRNLGVKMNFTLHILPLKS